MFVPAAGRSAQYVAVGENTGQAYASWVLPAGRWRLLTAKSTLVTDAASGSRFVALQIIGPDGFEVHESQVTPPAGVGPSTTSYMFGAAGGQNYTAWAPTYNFSLPSVAFTQDDTGLWAFAFHNSGTVGPGDIWQGTRFYVEQA